MKRWSGSSRSSSCVKLYVSSNPHDSVLERRALSECVFPRLRAHCRHTLGLDVRVIDPYESNDPAHWPDESSRQQLISDCRLSSAGPFLLALVGHQYGPPAVPAQVEVSEFQLLLQQNQQAGVSSQQLESLYLRDENTCPPSYCRRHGKTQSKDEVEMKEEEVKLRKEFHSAVSLCVHKGLMSPQRARAYYRSALDVDLRFALENRPRDDIRRCLVYVHKVVDPKHQTHNKEQNSDHSHTHRASETTPPVGDLLSELCGDFLPGLITSCQLLVYTTTTECDHRHGFTTARRRGFSESLCQQVYSDLLGLVESLNTSESCGFQRDALCRERAEHEEFCSMLSHLYDVTQLEETEFCWFLAAWSRVEQTCKLCLPLCLSVKLYFCSAKGSTELLHQGAAGRDILWVRAYVEQADLQCPLVVTGGPCTGKSVLLAHCAQQMRSWLADRHPVVISYFCSLSLKPSPKHFLSQLCHQISSSYHSNPSSNQDPSPSPRAPQDPNSDMKLCPLPRPDPITSCFSADLSLSEMKARLTSLLFLLPSHKQPLVLILDGLDQIQNHVSSHIIQCLPSPLPPTVKLILSASKRSKVLRVVQQHYPQCSSAPCGSACVQLSAVADRKQCVRMLTSLLIGSGRRVTSGQQALLNHALTSCSLPLYVRLLHTHASLWHSDSEVTESSLPGGVHSSISSLLDHLEQKHGCCLVGRALSYLTLSRSGLTEAELADLLCGDQEELTARNPQQSAVKVLQVDVERLLLDLKSFLLRRTVVGSKVLVWVSRHFGLVMGKRYLGTPEAQKVIHSEMADYFSRSAKPPPVSKESGPDEVLSAVDASAHVNTHTERQTFISSCLKPSKHVDLVNLRKAIELPHHLRESGRWEDSERELIMSPGFHQALVKAGLLEDLVAILEREGQRGGVVLASTLKSSACILRSSALDLLAVMETRLLPYVGVFPELEGYITQVREERRGQGGGVTVSLSPAPSTAPPTQHLQCDVSSRAVFVTAAAGTECGSVAEVTDDGGVWIWKGRGSDIVKVSLSRESSRLRFTGVKSSGRFVLLSTLCNKLLLWDVRGPLVFTELQDPLDSEATHTHSHRNVHEFVEVGKKVCVCWEAERFVSVFDVCEATLTRVRFPSRVTCLLRSSDGGGVLCGQDEGTVSMLDIKTCSLLRSWSNPNRRTIRSIVLREDTWEMACVDVAGDLTVWDTAAETQTLGLLKERFNGGETTEILSTDHLDHVGLFLVCEARQVALWDVWDWELWDQFLAPQGRAFTQAVLSQDGHLLLALLDSCPLVLVWSLSTGQCVLSLDPGTETQPLTLLNMASGVICVSRSGALTLWDSDMIYAAASAPKMSSGVKQVVVELTGETFYTSDGSQTVWKWSSAMGTPHASFMHHGPVEKILVSPNNSHLVTLSAGEIYIWQTETGENLLRISGSRASDVLITPNGRFGVSLSDGGLSRVWKLAHGGVVCSINLYLADAQVSPDSFFLLGRCRGDLLAASLWSGSISKRFSCVETSERVVAFHTLSQQPDFVVVLSTSGSVYTWKVTEETVCRHFQLPFNVHCQPQVFHMSSDGSYALLSTDNDVITFLDLSHARLCSVRAEGPIIKSCLDRSGSYAAYISRPSSVREDGVCDVHVQAVLAVVRLSDGDRLGRVCLSKRPSALAACEQQGVFVGFEDGSVGVYAVSEVMMSGERSGSFGETLTGCDRALLPWLPVEKANITWPYMYDILLEKDCAF